MSDTSEADKNQNSKRAKRANVSVRPTPEELEQLHARATSFGYKSLSQYLIERGLREGVMIQNVDREKIERLLFEVRKIGTNLNQMAHRMNEGYEGYSQVHLDRAMQQVERIAREVRQELSK